MERKQAWAQAIAAYREALTLKTVNDGDAQDRLAWVLATCPVLKYRDAAEAVTLAEKAVTANRNDGVRWITLGVAYYRAGRWAAALEALHKSRELCEGGDGGVFFLLAMTYWQKDDRKEAQRWYDTALRWIDKHQDALKRELEAAQDIARFRAEAEKLLQVGKKAPLP